MGCDIHFYVEVKKDGVWQSADKWTNPYGDGECVDYKDSYFRNRNYEFFALLAGVRNYNNTTPIAEPKGLPDDLSPQVKRDSEGWSGDGHSHSYFTLKELREFDWTRSQKYKGFVALGVWATFQGDQEYWPYSMPHSYCGDIHGPSIVKLSMEKANALLKKMPDKELWAIQRWARGNSVAEEEETCKKYAHIYVDARWEKPAFVTAKAFLSETMPRLWALGKDADVRIVFWFDN